MSRFRFIAVAAALVGAVRASRWRHAVRRRQQRQQHQRLVAPAVAARGGTIALLLPETKTARYETQDRPLFEARSRSCAPTARSSTRTPTRTPRSSSSRPRPR